MSGADWIEIVSVRGRRWTRAMVLSLAARMWRGLATRQELATIIDDPAWRRLHAGGTPHWAAADAGITAIARRAS
jgi:hypothetical protein